jgi:outer membrane protein, multidrug efflux system
MIKSIALAGSGCSLAPNYQRPAAPIPATYGVPTTVTTAQTTDWQQVFTNPALQQLITLSFKNNCDLRVAILNVETCQAQ